MNYFERTARTVSGPFVVPYIKLIYLSLGVLAFWFVEWKLNLGGTGYTNTYATIVTSILVLLIGMKPLYVAYTGQLGVIFSVVNLTDPSTTIPNTVRTHFKVVLWLILANNLVGLMLGNVEFGKEFTDATSMAFPNLVLLIATAIVFSYLFNIDGGSFKKRIITAFLVLILGIVAWNWVGPDNRKAIADNARVARSSVSGLGSSSGAGSIGCSNHVPLVEHGMRITVAVGCPVKVDQMNMRKGTDFKLVDPALRAVTGRQQLVTMDPDNNNRFVTFQANAEGLRRYGRTAIEVELYHAGTGDAEVARRYGVVTPDIDLTPTR